MRSDHEGVILFRLGKVFHRELPTDYWIPSLTPDPDWFHPEDYGLPACGIRRLGRATLRYLAEEAGRRPCARCWG